MKNLLKKLLEHKLRFFTISVLLTIMIGSGVYFIYSLSLLSGIENTLRAFLSFFTVIGIIIVTLASYNVILSKKKPRYVFLLMFLVIFNIISLSISVNVNKIYGKLANFVNTHDTKSSSLITLAESDVSRIEDIGNEPIGLLNDENHFESYIIPLDIIKEFNLKNKIIKYESYGEMLESLYNGDIKYIFVPTTYDSLFMNIEGYKNIKSDTKIIYTAEREIKKEIVKTNLKKPFTVLLMGVDSEQEDLKNSAVNGDSLLVFTVNPKNLTTTMLSIPRDTYVPIACFPGNKENKITHAAWYGEQCMAETIENEFDIDIDYFVKINFKGVTKLVDSLGGITVNVPLEFCEQDSNRDFDNEICLEKGIQTLNGEEALALARHRKTVNDFVRNDNQQLVIKGLLDKFKDIRDINMLEDIIDTLGNSVDTNMDISTILSFYNIGKDAAIRSQSDNIDEVFAIKKLAISGYDRMIYDYDQSNNSGMKLLLYNFVPYEGSIKDVSRAMKENLEIIPKTLIKTFVFDANETYSVQIIGKGIYDEDYLQTLPDFTGVTESEVRSYASRHNISLTVTSEAYDGSDLDIGDVFYQSIPAGANPKYLSHLTIKVASSVEEATEEDSLDEESEEDLTGEVPDGTGGEIVIPDENTLEQ